MAAIETKTFADIYTAVMEELKINSGDTVTRDRIKRDINMIYTQEVVPFAAWPWAKRTAQLRLNARESLTAAITQDSPTVTLSATHTDSLVGFAMVVDGSGVVYYVHAHTAGTALVTLETAFSEASGAALTVVFWNYRLPLPVDLIEVAQVIAGDATEPMTLCGPMELRRHFAANPFDGGLPLMASVVGPTEYAPFEAIGSLPATASRASAGLVKTLVFASTVVSYLAVGDRIRVTGAGHFSYNTDATVVSISTTTITYVGNVIYTQSTTADTGISVTRLSTRRAEEEYQELWVTPCYVTEAVTLTVDGKRRAKAMEADTDEPIIPLEDRNVLVYGARSLAWARERNDSESGRNYNLYQDKRSKMKAKFSGTSDQASIRVSRTYLQSKRSRRFRNFRSF